MTRRLRSALVRQKQNTEQFNQKLLGMLGIPIGGERRVEVPNRNSYVYVRLRSSQSEVIQAFNNRVAPSYNLPVVVERQGNRYVVLDVDTTRYDNNWSSYSPYLPRHGNTHSFDLESGGGGDIVWVHSRQFMPLLAFPSGSVGSPNIIVSPYILKKEDGSWRYVGNTGTASFTPYNPPNSGTAVMGLIALDTNSGNPYLLIGSGSSFSDTITGTSQIYSYIPPLTNPIDIPIAAIRLVSGTSRLTWDNIYDVRQFVQNKPTGSAGGISSVGVQDEGVSQGNVATFNFVGNNVSVSVSGSVARVFVTGSSSGSEFVGNTGSAVLTNSSGNLFTPTWLKWGTDKNPFLEFGADVPNKETNAGKFGYDPFNTDDIYMHLIGAGSGTNRKVRIDDYLTVGERINTRIFNVTDPNGGFYVTGSPHQHPINTGTMVFQNDGLVLGSAPIINAVDILDVSISGSVARMFVNAPSSESVLGGAVTITGSNGVYIDTGLSITLPAAGTYLITADVRGFMNGTAGGGTTAWWLTAKLFNSTDSADVANSERLIVLTGQAALPLQNTCPINMPVTVTASKTLRLYVSRNGNGTPAWTSSSIESNTAGRTNLTYLKTA